MNKAKQLNHIRERRQIRTRARLFGTLERPRLSVFRSNRYVSAQLIDDLNHKTLVSASTRELKEKNKIAAAEALGEAIAKKAKEIKVTAAVFDRGGYNYHGRVKAVAEGARKGGLQI